MIRKTKRANMNGLFVSIEGVEGVGKSTNHQFVCDYLRDRGHDVVATREPGGTPEAEKIRELLLDKENTLDAISEALLMFASRREHVVRVIRPALESGKTVVTDRFVDASFAYQGGARQLGFDTIQTLESLVLDGLRPNLTLLLDLDVEEGLKRLGKRGEPDRIEKESRDFFVTVREAYLKRAEYEPERIRRVDASGSLQQVQAQIAQTLDSYSRTHG